MYTGLIVFAAFLVVGTITGWWLVRRISKAEALRYAKIK
jgi:hypothetical protein